MSKTLISVLVWAPVFLAFELTANFWSGCPWYTLSETFWKLIAFWHPFWYFVLLFGIVLLGHFGYQWRARYLIAIGVIGTLAIIAHVFFRDVV